MKKPLDRALRRRVAILCRDRSPGWFAERVAAAGIAQLTRAGCRAQVISVAGILRRGSQFLEWLKNQGVDAVLCTGLHWLGQPTRPLTVDRLRLVHTDLPHPMLLGASNVTVDPAAVSGLVLDHLLSVGYRSCGYVITSEQTHAVHKFECFMAAARQRNLWNPDCLIDLRARMGNRPACTVHLGAQPRLKQAIRAAPKPLAICSHNDFVAAAVLDWLQCNHYEIPAEVGVVGCDDDPIYALAGIGLTTVHLPVEDIGAACAEIILEALRSPQPIAPTQRLLPPALVVRGSTLASGDPGRWLLEVIETIQANLTMKHLGPMLSARTGWGYDTVERRFKRAMGLTLLEYRDQLRLDRAAELLRQEPKLKIEYVCRQVGFSSPGRFAAAFRARHRVLPREFQLAASH